MDKYELETSLLDPVKREALLRRADGILEKYGALGDSEGAPMEALDRVPEDGGSGCASKADIERNGADSYSIGGIFADLDAIHPEMADKTPESALGWLLEHIGKDQRVCSPRLLIEQAINRLAAKPCIERDEAELIEKAKGVYASLDDPREER